MSDGLSVLRNPALEAAIVADPDDVATYLVYADWLLEQGDARGELIQLDHAIAGGAVPSSTILRAAQLRERLLADVLGADGRRLRDLVRSEWHLGHLGAITVSHERGRGGALLAARIAAHAAGCFLRHVHIELLAEDDVPAITRALLDVAPTLRSFVVRRPPRRVFPTCALDLSAVGRAAPRLRELELSGALVEDLEEFAATPWPAVERLRLVSPRYSDTLAPTLTTLLDGVRLPRLRRLELYSWPIADLPAIVAASPLARQVDLVVAPCAPVGDLFALPLAGGEGEGRGAFKPAAAARAR